MSNTSLFKSPEGAAKYLAAYDATLAVWPVPHQPLDVTTSFGTTHINAAGSADLPPLLLIHAFGMSSTQWYPNIAALSRDYRVYAPDVIDQMGRSVRTRPVQTRPNYACWLTEVLDALRIECVRIVGHSHGGWLTLNLALAVPQRVERMVLLSPAGSFAPLVWQFYARGMVANLIPIRPFVYGMMQWMTTAPLARGSASIEQFLMGIRHYRLQQLGVPTVYTDDELRHIRTPTLLLVGEREVIYKPSQVLERARRLIPHIEAELIAGGGHAFTADQADATNTRILEFLRRN